MNFPHYFIWKSLFDSLLLFIDSGKSEKSELPSWIASPSSTCDFSSCPDFM